MNKALVIIGIVWVILGTLNLINLAETGLAGMQITIGSLFIIISAKK